MSAIKRISVYYFVTLTFLLLLVGYLKDNLLFFSDWHSLAAAFGFIALLALPFVFFAIWLLSFLSRKRDQDEVSVNLLVLSSRRPFLIHLGSVWLKQFDHFLVYVVGLVGALGCALFVRVPNLSKEKIEKTAFCSVIVFLVAVVYGYVERGGSPLPAAGSKSIVYVVIDALGADEIGRYNREAHTPAFDRLAQQGAVFDKMRTSYTYTYGYFATLYRGYSDISKGTHESVLSKLQKLGWNVSWSSFHSNGIPETSFIYGYEGLRSFFLTQNFVWIPRVLRIPYHVYRYQGYVSSQKIEAKGKQLHYFLNRYFGEDQSLSRLIGDSVSGLSSTGRPFVYIFHSHKYGFNQGALITQLWARNLELRETSEQKQDRLLVEKFEKQGRTYEAQYEDTVRRWRLQEMKYADSMLNEVEILQKNLQAMSNAKDIVMIVTADHGSISQKGKLWYGMHNDEEVARVPFLVMGAGHFINEKNYDSIDIMTAIEDILNLPRGSVSSQEVHRCFVAKRSHFL
ncbi:sulfatase-like hydrolase/transferase [Bdellovibrio bacteriovorus]|uniref:sulfatase-like hydrolase/transferase n=1 Tax=Bdellovibrio bacteriovorus TaxID=959 RepID=UPI0035A6F6C3